jgi:hypothetical protein
MKRNKNHLLKKERLHGLCPSPWIKVHGKESSLQSALLFDTDADWNVKTRKQNIKEKKKKKKTGVAEV